MIKNKKLLRKTVLIKESIRINVQLYIVAHFSQKMI